MKGAWKSIYLALGLLTLVPQLSQARLNESLTQCRSRYGEPKQLLANSASQIVGGIFESHAAKSPPGSCWLTAFATLPTSLIITLDGLWG